MIYRGECQDPFEWFKDGSRTMKLAHEFIRDMFDSLVSGEVIDIEFLLKEKPTKKISERFS